MPVSNKERLLLKHLQSSLEEKQNKQKVQNDKLIKRIKDLETDLKNKQKTSDRKLDNKRKYLVGAYFLGHARDNGGMINVVDSLNNIMNRWLDRDYERALFDLPPLSPAPNSTDQTTDPDVPRLALQVKQGDPCPRCATGKVTLRAHKDGLKFYACSEYFKSGCNWTADYTEQKTDEIKV